MKKILFVCHGNICRSPMAEMVMKQLVCEAGREHEFEIASAAVSTEEIGNDIYPPARRKLAEKGVPFTHRAARQMTRADYQYYDYIVCMDENNIYRLRRLIGEAIPMEGAHGGIQKVSLLLQWAGKERDVADPWYTGDFETTYRDILAGCQAMIEQLS